ncbi:MAG: SDR family NAD(P)-dependent oxidoreductase [Proteobacteria bacterium]|nr:SDR family NAD(P)-dependent oxidoreductase [Pseudomonadota bacterium]
MIGITSYGGYIPRLRLNRMSIVENVGWFAPAIVAVAQGERSFCNWDEDSLTMAVAAARDCLTGADRPTVDGVFLASTTLPYQDRLNAGIVKTALNLKDQVDAADFTSGLRAGTTALIQALMAVKSGDRESLLVAATDKRLAKTAYFYEMWFGDGAASMLVGSKNVIAEFLGSFTVTHDFVDHYRGLNRTYDYMWEERWVRDEGYSKIIPQAVSGLFEKLSITMDDVDRFVFPCFFKAEHRKIAAKLGADPDKVPDNLHEVCGETGAAHPLVMLALTLDEAEPGQRILVCGFGQGCDALYFKVTEAIKDLAPRRGIKGSLDHKLTTTNYTKFLKFRGLLPTEMGLRAEAPTQTPLTALWRRRDMVLGLVGGRCAKCGTPQLPRMDICVNPECRAVGAQEPYEFADRPARVKSFTGDLLAVSVDPPAVYGLVEFGDGGRLMADFTDCEMSDVHVGQRVTMSFRRKYTDDERGFSGYFWKAVPVIEDKPAAKAGIRFDDRVAVVTGAGAGLGRAYALELAARGAKVVVNDLGGARDGTGAGTRAADEVVDEITKNGGQAVANYDSVATPEGGENIVRTALDAFGRLDILINNAGILRDRSLLKMEPDDWDRVMAVHLDGAYHVTRPAVRAMRRQGYGRIILTSSAAGLYGNFGQTNYSAAKMALIGFMNTLKLEGEKYDILVNTVAPVAGTRLTEDVLPPDLFERSSPEFVTPLVLYLCSDGCQLTGQIYNTGLGYIDRAAVVTSAGVVIGDGRTPPTVEDIHQHFAAIDELNDPAEFRDAMAALTPLLDAFSPKKEAEAAAEGAGGLTVAGVFGGMADAFQPGAAAGVDVVFQFNISGAGGGDWVVSVKDGRIAVDDGTIDQPTTVIKMGDEDFVALIKGELNPMSAFTSGKLRIEGDIMKSQLIDKLFKF